MICGIPWIHVSPSGKRICTEILPVWCRRRGGNRAFRPFFSHGALGIASGGSDMDFRLLFFFFSLVGWEFKEVLSVSDDVCVEGDLNYIGGTIEYAHCIFPLRSWAIIIRRKGPWRVRVRIVGLWDSLKSKLHEDGPFQFPQSNVKLSKVV